MSSISHECMIIVTCTFVSCMSEQTGSQISRQLYICRIASQLFGHEWCYGNEQGSSYFVHLFFFPVILFSNMYRDRLIMSQICSHSWLYVVLVSTIFHQHNMLIVPLEYINLTPCPWFCPYLSISFYSKQFQLSSYFA